MRTATPKRDRSYPPRRFVSWRAAMRRTTRPGCGVPRRRCPPERKASRRGRPTPREHLAVYEADEHIGHVDRVRSTDQCACARPRGRIAPPYCSVVAAAASVCFAAAPRRSSPRRSRRLSIMTRRPRWAVSRDSRRVRDVVGSNPGGGGTAAPRAARCRFRGARRTAPSFSRTTGSFAAGQSFVARSARNTMVRSRRP